ncbi:hypothetical protein D3C71_2052370 [compost metagenome]
MAYSVTLAKFGFVKGVGAAPQSAPRENLTTDPYYTDGLRCVLVFDHTHTSLAEIEFFLSQGIYENGGQSPGRVNP